MRLGDIAELFCAAVGGNKKGNLFLQVPKNGGEGIILEEVRKSEGV